MSYDIELRDPVTKEVLELPTAHVMVGGIYAADYDPKTNTFLPRPIREAHLNITYNYARYYYAATDKDPRFAHDEISAYYADGTTGPVVTEYGIRGIYGKSGAESINMLQDMIQKIKQQYKDAEGRWISTQRAVRKFYDKKTGKELDYAKDIFRKRDEDSYVEKQETVTVWEGDTRNYWDETAANAMRPLYQLLAMARLRPDGIWDGD